MWLRYGLQHSDLHPVLPTPMSWSQVLVRGSKNLTAKGANLLIFMIFSHEKSQLANFQVLLLRLYCLVTVTWGLKKYHSRPKHEWHIYKCYICYHMLCYIPIYTYHKKTVMKVWTLTWCCNGGTNLRACFSQDNSFRIPELNEHHQWISDFSH